MYKRHVLFSHVHRDVDDEMDWIREKEPLASSANRGRDLIGVQNLIKYVLTSIM